MKAPDVRQFISLAIDNNASRIALASALAIVFGLTLFTTPAAHAQTFSVIHTFNGSDGATPLAGLTLRGGVLYGTTWSGGMGQGTVFQLTRSGSNWTSSLLSEFATDGATPEARVQFGPDGHLYGTTVSGGSQSNGIVFRLTPPLSICKTANCMWTETAPHRFIGPPDGSQPLGGDMAFDQQGNIYGTTSFGGGGYSYGVVWKLTPSYTESVIHTFSGPDGIYPYGGLIIDNKGNLLGTTSMGGANNFGAVYQLTFNPGVGWVQTVLYSFQNGSDGQGPFGGLLMDASGNLYGATYGGGDGGGGVVYKLSPSGNGWTFAVLYSLAGTYQCGPQAALSMDAAGNLYGTTLCDGANKFGNVFKLTNTVNGWTYTSLHDFSGANDGLYPVSNVTIDAGGNLYGTTSGDGNRYSGTVWQITP